MKPSMLPLTTLLAAMVLGASGAAQASTVFQWEYFAEGVTASEGGSFICGGDCPDVTASGTFTADPTGSPNEYLISGITGTRNGIAITGLLAIGSEKGNDNLLYFPESAGPSGKFLTGNGFSYQLASTPAFEADALMNFYFTSDPFVQGYVEDTLLNKVTDASFFKVTLVPIPAAVWLFGSALAGLGVIGRRKAG